MCACTILQEMVFSMSNDNRSKNEDLIEYFSPTFTEMGLCYTFYDSMWMVHASGSSYGLTMFLNPGIDEYYFSTATPGSLGIRVTPRVKFRKSL